MINFIIVSLFIIVAGISNAVMDKLQFHYGKSIFSKWPQTNPNESWKNKWKLDEEGNPVKYANGKLKERFPLSSTALVLFTDLWHFAQFVMLTCFTIAIVIFTNGVWFNLSPFFSLVLEFAWFKILFSISFELFYSKIFSLKKIKTQ